LNYKPFASIKEGSSPRFCNEGTLNAADAGVGMSYSWSRGSTILGSSTSITVSESGTYKLTVTESVSGCSASFESNVSMVTMPSSISISADVTVLCPGGKASLSTDDIAGAIYQWQLNGKNINGNSSTIEVGSAGTYRVIVYIPGFAATCSAESDELSVVVSEKPVVKLSSEFTDLTAVVTGTYTNIEWYRYNAPGEPDTELPEYSGKLVIQPEAGRYRVKVTYGSGCELWSALYYFSPETGVDDGGKDVTGFLVYPNPTNGVLNIVMDAKGPAKVTVTDQLGRNVQSHNFDGLEAGLSIDLSTLPVGCTPSRS